MNQIQPTGNIIKAIEMVSLHNAVLIQYLTFEIGNSTLYYMDNIQQLKIQEIWNCFTTKTPILRRHFQVLDARTARVDFKPCKPKSYCFMREYALKRIPFFVDFSVLYVVFIFSMNLPKRIHSLQAWRVLSWKY